MKEIDLRSRSFPLWPFLFVTLSATALVVNLIHKPWLRPLKTQNFVLAAGHGGLLLGTVFFWTLSIKYFGPIKTIILTELSDWWIPPLWLLCTNRSHLLSAAQIRGSILVAASIVAMFFFSTVPEFPSLPSASPSDPNLSSSTAPSTVTYGGLGVFSLLAASLFILGRKTFSRNIQGRFRASGLSTAPTKKDGGVKALSGLGLAFAAAVSSIPAFFQYFFGQGSQSTYGYSFWMLIAASFFVFIADFYTEGSSRAFLTRRIHVAVVMLPTLILPIILYAFSYHTQMDLATVLSFLGIVAGLILLSNTKEDEDLLPTTSDTATSSSDSFRFPVAEFGLQKILADSDSRKIFIFMCANLSFMFVELAYGYITNSLGLISDAFHMLFDCTALAIGLYASLMKRWPVDRDYTYGYGRVQILSGFANGIFLCFIAFSVFIEAVKRIYEPPEIFTEKLILVSSLGFCVNLVGLYAFHDHSGHSHGGKKEKSHDDNGHGHEHSHDKGKQKEKQHDHSHENHHGHSHDGHGKDKHEHEDDHGDDEHDDNMYGVFLHVLADTLGSVGVIVSSSLIHFFGWWIADPIASLIISLLIGLSVIPLLKSTAKTLLQGIPSPISKKYDRCVAKIKKIEGVIDVASPHFWSHTQTQIVGTAVIVIYEGFDSQDILRKALSIFSKFGVQDMTIQIEVYRQLYSLQRHLEPAGRAIEALHVAASSQRVELPASVPQVTMPSLSTFCIWE